MKNKKINYEEIDLSANPEKFEEMMSKSNGARTVPQMFVNETHIGDCDYVHELDLLKLCMTTLHFLLIDYFFYFP